MNSSHAFRRFAFAFGPAFAVTYVSAFKQDIAMFTVYPTRLLSFKTTQYMQDVTSANGLPAMHWYGWMATAALGALIIGVFAILTPDRWLSWIWQGWVWLIPLVAMLMCVYFTLPMLRN